ncbi:hypothetical protein [Rhizobium lentis]|uniref:Uncharacterized protein (DUF433 family) n=1 Tax=Rhizobium lentis TaxID=1138194 RepID=A0A7W8UMB5_9HYPH|nr:hypothetical protein [Rhizobium lentis]MBB4574434.1 uncharacterized protein (DUF433 family) [Rhizobium lentis]MBB5550360.1 uncharacterized protein (DUF433 family) [Rhizobium lentis]MBB5560611.1 uncharacterized protein (DUF433 family) [Rhizobium lentis]MBB5567196.1 uncharacterized protein (DUF433 family) [Rhizobium lentis]
MTKPRKLPNDDVLRQLVAEGLTRAEIAARYQVHRTTLSQKLADLGLADATAKEAGERRPFQVEEVRQLLRSGMSFSDIDRHYGRTVGCAWCFCRTHNLIPEIPDLDIREDKIVIGINATATDRSGAARTVRMAISLPPISMFAAARQQRGETMGAR